MSRGGGYNSSYKGKRGGYQGNWNNGHGNNNNNNNSNNGPYKKSLSIIKVMANHKQIPTTVIKGKITTITTATEVTNGIEITIIKIINPQIPILAEETIVPIITCLLSQ